MSEGLRAFDAMWERIRQPNEALRPRLAAWLREVVPATNPNQENAAANAFARQGTWLAHLTIGRGPAREFPIAPTVPEEPTEVEWQLLGLNGAHRTFVPMAWLLELLGEAWMEADVPARGFPLYFAGSGMYRGPGGRMKWKDLLRGMAFRATAPLPPGLTTRSTQQDNLVAPPSPEHLPATPTALQDACIAGEPDAPLAWADALEAAGDRTSPDLLRWVHGFAPTLIPGVAEWAGHGAFYVFARAETCWWGQGEFGSEPNENTDEANRLADLLQGWNVYYPAIEWLLRRAGLAKVDVGAAYFANGGKTRSQKLNLSRDQHLAPVDEFSGVVALSADPPKRRK
jgi:hypothetical protein